MNRFGKKILCGCLAVSLMLTSVGCSEKTENAEEQTISVEKAARVNNGDLQGDSIAVAVGKQGVTYDEYLVYNWFLKNQYDSMLGTDVWNISVDDHTIGQTAESSRCTGPPYNQCLLFHRHQASRPVLRPPCSLL